jgi:nucleotide-binding universal stress UspA family protein
MSPRLDGQHLENLMKILIAIDGSKAALHAVKYAVKLSAQLSSKPHITLITAHDHTGLKHLSKYAPKGELDDYFREISDRDLKPARALLDKANLDHDMVIKSGHVAEQIIKVGDAGKFDLIVLGAKGRSGFGDLLLGSVAQRVSATSKRPVVLVK